MTDQEVRAAIDEAIAAVVRLCTDASSHQVTGTRLHCRTAGPRRVSPESRDLGETLELRYDCMNYGSDVQDKRYCAGTRELY